MNCFSLTDEQTKMVRDWEINHTCSLRTENGDRYVGAIGGATTYCFTPNGLGQSVVVKCACGDELDLTDYEEW